MKPNEPASPTLRQVLGSDLCSGCGLCAGIGGDAISMVAASDGFNRPVQHEPLPIQIEAAIATACPGAVLAPWPPAPQQHPYWGSYRFFGTGHATDQDLRHHASSGGLISAIAIHALREGLVDAVVQVIGDPEHPMQNLVIVSFSEAEVISAAGSRYAPSSPLAGLDGLLQDDRRFAFIGKPCDASALRRLAGVDPRVDEHFPLILSFFCGGIPSRLAADRLLAAMGVEPRELAAFRYRGDGWPGQARALRRDGSAAEMSYMDSWGAHLSKIVQFRCKICADAVGGVADIACADAWYGDDRGYPLFDERDGRSAVVARTELGERLLRQAIAAGAIKVTPLAIHELDRMQPAQARRKRLALSRYAALAVSGRARPRAKGVALGASARRAGAMETLKSFFGMLRRILRASR